MRTKGKKILITGGAGFIGTNIVKHFQKNHEVIVIDDLSRKGTDYNLAYLEENFDIDFHRLDISEAGTTEKLLQLYPDIDVVIHLAAQVAVTTSVEDPRNDFEINAHGTFNILEYARRISQPPIVIYASTNKVYGALEAVDLVETRSRYQFKEITGIDETCQLEFHSPYGCSKGCADQYVADYARIYNLPTVVFRQSCIYGEHQFGVEDQGWVAWFIIASLLGRQITIYGDGKQVRDLLHVSDLADAYARAIDKIDSVRGQIFNLGGGYSNSLSILEFFELIKNEYKLEPPLTFRKSRSGDQKIFISDNHKARRLLGWEPAIAAESGIDELYDWLRNNVFESEVFSQPN